MVYFDQSNTEPKRRLTIIGLLGMPNREKKETPLKDPPPQKPPYVEPPKDTKTGANTTNRLRERDALSDEIEDDPPKE